MRSKHIRHNTHTSRRSNFRLKPTPIKKSDSNDSISRSHFSKFPQAVAKFFYHLSQTVSSASKIIDLVINGFSPNHESINIYICYHSIVVFDIREKCLGLSNTSHVDSLYRFIITVVDKFKTDICL